MKSKIFYVLVFIGFLGSLNAQTSPREITSEDAVDLAVQNNLGLALEDAKIAIKRRENQFAWNRFLPGVTASAAMTRLNEPVTASGLAPVFDSGLTPGNFAVRPFSQEVDPWNLGFNLTAQLPLSWAMFRGIEQTLIDYDNSVLSRVIAEKRLRRDVKKTFYQLLALQEAIRITELQLESSRQRYLQTQASFKAGRVPELSVLQTQVAWETRKPALEDQKLSYSGALMQFKFLLGLDLQVPLLLKGAIVAQIRPPLEATKILIDHLQRRLDVQNASAGLKSLKNVFELQKDLLLPNLILQLSMDPGINDPFNGDSWNLDKFKQRSGAFSIILSWKLDSLVPGSSSWVGLENLGDQIRQAELGLEQTMLAGAMEITNLVDRLRKGSQSLKALELNIELAQRAYQLADQSYRAGGQSLLEVQDTELQLQGARLQLLQEKLTYNNTILDLEFALDLSQDQIWKQGNPQ